MRCFPRALDDVVAQRVDLALTVCAADNEIIGEQGHVAQVQHDDVTGLLLRGEIYDLPGEVLRLQPGLLLNPLAVLFHYSQTFFAVRRSIRSQACIYIIAEEIRRQRSDSRRPGLPLR